MATKTEALRWINEGYDITPIRVTYDDHGHASKSPFLSYASDKIDKLWVLSNWKKNFEIGLVLNGEDYVVFDFDDMRAYERFVIEHPSIKHGIKEQSVSGRGVHVFFLNTESIIQAISIIDGLDIKASKNNFAVVNPMTDLEDTPELPEDLWIFYESNKGNARKSFESEQTTTDDILELNMIVDGFGPEGNRNKNMSLLVWTLLTLGFNKQQLTAIVNLANSHSGLSEDEINKTIDAAWRKWTNGR